VASFPYHSTVASTKSFKVRPLPPLLRSRLDMGRDLGSYAGRVLRNGFVAQFGEIQIWPPLLSRQVGKKLPVRLAGPARSEQNHRMNIGDLLVGHPVPFYTGCPQFSGT